MGSEIDAEQVAPLTPFEITAWKIALRRHGDIDALFLAKTGKTLYDETAWSEFVKLISGINPAPANTSGDCEAIATNPFPKADGRDKWDTPIVGDDEWAELISRTTALSPDLEKDWRMTLTRKARDGIERGRELERWAIAGRVEATIGLFTKDIPVWFKCESVFRNFASALLADASLEGGT